MKIYVVFIGGFKSDQTAVGLWLASAKNLRGDVDFDAYPFPNINDSGRDSSVAGFEDQFDEVIKKIQDSHADKIFIVGHSSGCAIADEVNKRLGGDRTNVTLVDLDGFPPLHDQIAKSQAVQVWYAVGPHGKGESLNHKSGRIKYRALHATETWSLHFSLVNKAATNKINHKTYKTEGYAGCIANLDFLDYKAK